MTSIFFVISRADVIGGAQVHVVTLAQIARNNNYNVTIISGHSTGDLVDWCSSLNLSYIYLPGLSNNSSLSSSLRALLCFIDLYANNPSAIFSLHSTKVGLLCRLASLFARPKFIFTVHGWGFTNQLFSLKGALIYLFEAFASLLSLVKGGFTVYVSQFDFLNRPFSLFPCSQRHLIIYNSVIDRQCSEDTASDGLITSDQIKICMIGRFTPQKSQSNLIRAMVDVSDAELLLIGDGPLLQYCIDLAVDLGISHKVSFLGRLSNSEATQVLSKCNIYALISNWEGLPRSIIEALSFGLPIIASDVGGCSELFTSHLGRSNGVLLSNNSPLSISKALKTFIHSSQFRSQASFLSRSHYNRYFNMNVFADKYLALWHLVSQN